MMSINFSEITRKFSEFFILGLIFLLPLFAGGLYPWTFHLLIAIIIILSAINLVPYIRPGPKATPPRAGLGVLLVSVFFLVSCLQILPIPINLVNVLAPEVGRIYKNIRAAGVELPRLASLAIWPTAARVQVMLIASYILIFLLVKEQVFSNPKSVRKFVWVVFLSGTFQAAFGMVEFLRDSETILGITSRVSMGVITGSFINPNHFAYWIELTLPMGLAARNASLSFRSSARISTCTVSYSIPASSSIQNARGDRVCGAQYNFI